MLKIKFQELLEIPKIILVYLILICNTTYSQILNTPVNVQSPTVANIASYGEVPLNNYTGLTSIEIPICEIIEGNIKIPIKYSQSTLGFKSDVHPGWVGNNGTLVAGGILYRTVKGVPDDNPTFIPIGNTNSISKGNFDTGNNALISSSDWAGDNRIISYADSKADEPDEFSFNCPSGSGKFYYGNDGSVDLNNIPYPSKIVVESEQFFKVEFLKNTNGDVLYSVPPFCRPPTNESSPWDTNNGFLKHLRGFKVTDQEGTQYFFGNENENIPAVEYSVDFFNQRSDSWIANAWHLTKIVDKNNNEINLEYERKEPIAQMYVSVSTYDNDIKWIGNKKGILKYGVEVECSTSSVSSTPHQGIYGGKLVSPLYLKLIEGKNNKVVFTNSETTELRYDYSIFDPYRIWFQGTINNGPGGYIADLFPYLHSCGYMLNATISNKCAAGNNCEGGIAVSTLLDRLKWNKLDKIEIYDKVSNDLKRQFDFNYTNSTATRLKLLSLTEKKDSKIKGTYSFEYYNFPTKLPPGYLKTHTDHWGFNNGISVDELDDFNNVFGSTKFINYGSAKRDPSTDLDLLRMEILKTVIYPTGGKTDFSYEFQNYNKKVDISGRWNPVLPNDINNSDLNGGGIRIKKITSYDPLTSTILNEKEYLYLGGLVPSNNPVLTNLKSSGVLGHIAKYYIPSIKLYNSNKDPLYTQTLNNQFSTQSLYAMGENTSGSPVGYSEVVEKITSGANVNGWTIYKYSNMESKTLWDGTTDNAHLDVIFDNSFQTDRTPYEPFNSKALERGKLISLEIFTNNGLPVSKKAFQYQALNNSNIRSIKAQYSKACNSNVIPPLYEGTAYKISAYKYLLVNELSRDYDISNSLNFVSLSSTYTYNSIGQLQQKTIIESDGSTNRVKNKYISDYSFPSLSLCEINYDTQVASCNSIPYPGNLVCINAKRAERDACLNQPMYKEAAAIVAMQQKNILPPVEQINTKEKSGIVSSKGSITLFEDFGTEGGLQPKEIKTLQIAQAASIPFSSIDGNKSFVYDANYINSQLVFNKYDNKGNPLEISRKGDISSYLWGYNQLLPIAEIKNATYSTAIASLGSGDLTALNLGYYLNGQNKVSYTDLEMRTKMDPLKNLTNALATTYTYDRINGLTSTVSPNNLITYFEYDDFKRLKTIKDQNGKPIKGFNYKIGTSNTVTEIIPRISLANSTIDFTIIDDITSTNTSSYTSFQDTYQLSKSYYDGLGRPLQTVAYKAGGTGSTLNDIVTNGTSYDIFGRATKTYIPFLGTGALAFTGLPADNTYFYSEITAFDNSALNRPLITFGPGSAWRVNSNSANASKMEYAISPSNTVRLYEINANGANNIGTYSSPLYKTVSISEQGNKVTEYKDNVGRIIQKDVELRIKDRQGEDGSIEIASTAYVYDDFGQLRFVIQPKAFVTGSNILNTDLKLAFAYKYDDKGRVTDKQIPGGGWTSIVYDKKDRPVMTQNALQAGLNKWTYTKYDALNRDVESGEQIFGTNISRTDLQKLFNALSGESFPTTYIIKDMNNMDITIANTESKRVKKYYDAQSESIGANNYYTAYSNYKGLLTKTQTSTISNDFTNPYDNHFFYDEKGRIIQTKNRHHLSTSPDITNFEYNFTGDVLRKHIVHNKDATSITEIVTNTYDHLGRILTVNHNVNGNSKNLAKYNYDNLGRLSKKEIQPNGNYSFSRSSNVSSTSSGNYNNNLIWSPQIIPGIGSNVTIANNHTITVPNNERGISKYIANNGTITLGGAASVLSFDDCNISNASNMSNLQTIDYTYHLRGWLKGINETMTTTEADLFSYKLDYETAPAGFQRYDGNIGKQTWKNCEAERSYTYTHDKASRLLSGTYSGLSGENFSLSNMTYDVNGNIITLQRNGKNGISLNTLIDNLNYTYNGNRLLSVSDGVTGNENVGDFRNDAANSNLDYEYNDNGNLLSDSNEDIGSIAYDTYLNQPSIVYAGVGRNIKYRYDGAGNLLQTEYSTSETWDFVNGLVYKKASSSTPSIPYQISTAEGRYIFDGNQFEYDYKDHLGNTRLSFKEQSGKLIKTAVTNFDPWGMVLKGIGSNNTPENRWELQGHEKENTFGLNRIQFGARTYNPTIGRWDVIDPLAEKYFDNASYNYVINNPMHYLDPNGKEIWILFGDNQKVKYENGNIYNEDGTKYKGKDKFISTIKNTLNKMNSTKIGASVLQKLVDSKNKFNFENVIPKSGSTAQFAASSNETANGGNIRAGNLSSNKLDDNSKLEALSHELFHGYQNENQEFGASINKEVGAYIFGISVVLEYNINNGITANFGNSTEDGLRYQNSFQSLLYNGYSQKEYETAILNFKCGSLNNQPTKTRPNGVYSEYPIMPFSTNPTIKNISPYIR